MTVSKRLRYEVLRRDNHACRYCGATAPDVVLTVDHVLAVALGGTDDPGNLVTACRDCNSGKSATPADAALVADVQQDAIRWAAAMQRATELAVVQRDKVTAITRDIVDTLAFAQNYIPVDADKTVASLLAAGLAPDEIRDSAYTALAADHIRAASGWKYFCGVCWKKVAKRREEAAALLAREAEQPDNTTEAAEQDAFSQGWDAGWDRCYLRRSYEIEQYDLLKQVCDNYVSPAGGAAN